MKFHTKDPQILGATEQNLVATLQNLVAMADCRSVFMHPCTKPFYKRL
jgi:hypothetical protein